MIVVDGSLIFSYIRSILGVVIFAIVFESHTKENARKYELLKIYPLAVMGKLKIIDRIRWYIDIIHQSVPTGVYLLQ